MKEWMLKRLRWFIWFLMKAEARRWRRVEVAVFYVLLLLAFINNAGLDHSRHLDFLWQMLTALLFLFSVLNWYRPLRVMRSLRDLDERSIAMYGMGFNRLTTEQVRAVDRTREPGSREAYDQEDEFAVAGRRTAVERAFAFLRPALLIFAGAYWAVYLWLPEGLVRRKLTDDPMVMMWLIVFVLTLPEMILMWREPDELEELSVAVMQKREA
jgi:hypothetical protein